MEEQDLRILAAERAVVELSAASGAATRAKALAPLLEELQTATGDERLVLQAAVDLLMDGKLLSDALRFSRWIKP